MFCKIKELLDRLEIIHLDQTNPSFDEVIKNILCKSNVDKPIVNSYYLQ